MSVRDIALIHLLLYSYNFTHHRFAALYYYSFIGVNEDDPQATEQGILRVASTLFTYLTIGKSCRPVAQPYFVSNQSYLLVMNTPFTSTLVEYLHQRLLSPVALSMENIPRATSSQEATS